MRADQANRWQEGLSEVWILRGQCEVAQGIVTARGREAVLWVTRGEAFSGQDSKIIAYFEGDVSVDYRSEAWSHAPAGVRPQSIRDQTWLGRFSTSTEIEMQAPVTGFQPKVRPAILQRGLAARDADGGGTVQPTQFSTALPGYLPERPSVPAGPPAWSPSIPPSSLPGLAPRTTIAPGAVTGPGMEYVPPPAPSLPTQPTARRIVLRSRSNVRMQGKVFPSANGQETIALITSGVNVVVDGIQNLRGLATDKIDIETDRIVIWTSRLDALDLSGQSSGEKLQTKDTPLEFYLEGNIVFREGDRVIYAERMYYNVRGRYGIVLNAEILTPVPSYQGLVRLKADVLQQLNEANFRASGAALTSSRLGVPSYWLQAQNIEFRDLQTSRLDPFTGQVAIDPETKEAAVDHQYLATSRNNFLFLGGVPVFYWPVLATNLQKPTYFVDSVRIKTDSVFGFQVFTDLDMFQLLGIQDPPEGTKWDISPDYLSKRGFALGTHGRYDRFGFFNIPGPVKGSFDAWGVQDYASGDNLGADRPDVPFDEHLRGHVLWDHRQYLPNGFQFTGEVGWISDRNFQEEYYKTNWDEHKDYTTGVELKQLLDQQSWSISSDVWLNGFVTQTQWIPRLDHFLLGQSLFDRLTWSAHTHVGYAQLYTGSLPPPGTEPTNASLPWETDLAGNRYTSRAGVLAATRQELDLPLQLGPVKLTPYVLGEIAYWQQDRDQVDLTRAYGQAGLRASLPFWKVDPNVHSDLFNLNGMAHKISLDAEGFYADANQDLNLLPLYEPLQDDATEHFQRRFIENLFGGTLPKQYDDRYFALRSGMQDWVTAPSTEIANTS